MPALRRGIAHYQGGSADTQQSDADFIARRAASYNQGRGLQTITPVTPAPAPALAATMTDPMSGAVFKPPLVGPPTSGAGQLFTGDFAGARDNPESSPATAALGQFGDYVSRVHRAQNLAGDIASPANRLMNLFFGTRASTQAIADRDATANALNDELVQKYLVSNPDQLAIAERDPRGYAIDSTKPEFRQKMTQAVANHVEAAANPRVSQDEHPQVVKDAIDKNITATQAHAAMAPDKYTKEEFVKIFSGIPTATFMEMFGRHLQHVETPQEKAAAEVMDRLHGDFLDKHKRVTDMEADIREANKNKVTSPHVIAPWFGTSPYDAAKAERDKAYTATMEAARSLGGITLKPFAIPGQTN